MLNTFGFYSWLVQLMQLVWLKLNTLLINNKIVYKYMTTEENARQLISFENIPTVKGAPIVGTLFNVIAAGGASRLHEYIDKRHKEYGVIFRERLGGTEEAVFVASAKLMRSVFLYEGQCPRHPLPDAWLLYNKAHNQKRGLFFMDGDEWLKTRRILNRLLLTGNLEWMKNEVNASTAKLVNKWKHEATNKNQPHDGYEIKDLEGELYRWSIDVICAIMFGSNYTDNINVQNALDEFAQIVYKIFESSSALMNFPAKLAQSLKLRIWQEFERNVGDVLAEGSAIIDKFLSLLAKQDDDESLSETTLYGKLMKTGMSLDMLKRIFVDLVIAAADTTAYSTEWSLYLLGCDSKIQQQVFMETLNGEENYIYLRGLIKETLRLYPVAPFVGRYLASDAAIGEFFVRKNTLVLLSLYSAGRDPEHFPEPLLVKPERWQRNEATGLLDGVLQAHGSLPFAIGHRACIGKRIALTQMEILLRTVVTNFRLKCLNKTQIEPILRMITVPEQPLQLVIQLRPHI